MALKIFRAGGLEHTIEDLPKRSGIRWAVGSFDGPRSSTWRLWGDKKGDVYLSMRSLGGVIKASFHRDRRCSVGFTSEYHAEARARFGVQSRHMSRWTLPEKGVVRAAQILIPNDDLLPFEEIDAAQMRWLPAAGPGFATVISVFIAEPPELCTWSDPQTDGNLVGVMSTPKRFTWVVATDQLLDQSTISMIEDGRKKALLAANVKVLPDKQGLRLAIWGNSATPADLFFIDLSIFGKSLPADEVIANC
jgi:hypothetical protein